MDLTLSCACTVLCHVWYHVGCYVWCHVCCHVWCHVWGVHARDSPRLDLTLSCACTVLCPLCTSMQLVVYVWNLAFSSSSAA